MTPPAASAAAGTAASARPPGTKKLVVKVCVRPGSGHVELKRRELDMQSSWSDVYSMIVAEGKLELGPLQKIELDCEFGTMEVMEDETVHDAVASDAKVVVLTCHQPSASMRDEPRAPVLVRSPLRSVPEWSHNNQENMTECYRGLRTLLLDEGLGFLDPEKWGKQWMIDLNKVLYHISPYHANFKSRGFILSKAWAFSDGLKSKIKGRKVPDLSVDVMREAVETINTLMLATHLRTDPFEHSDFVVHLDNLETVLSGVTKNMVDRAENERKRPPATLDLFARRAEPGTTFRKLDSTPAVHRMFVDFDAALRAQAMDSPLSTEMFEPVDRATRNRWYAQMKLSIECWVINFDVPGMVGALHWVVKVDGNLDEADRMNALESMRRRLRPLIPNVHSRSMRRLYFSKMKGLHANLSFAAASFIYKALTGDESLDRTDKEKCRTAYAMAHLWSTTEPPADMIMDLRAHHNSLAKGKSVFDDFWDVVAEVG